MFQLALQHMPEPRLEESESAEDLVEQGKIIGSKKRTGIRPH